MYNENLIKKICHRNKGNVEYQLIKSNMIKMIFNDDRGDHDYTKLGKLND